MEKAIDLEIGPLSQIKPVEAGEKYAVDGTLPHGPILSVGAEIEETIRNMATSYQGNSFKLLELLRFLENLHQQIRENQFMSSLPNNRQQLYALLKEIESSGGWPYIPRLKIHSLLANFPLPDETTSGQNTDV